MKALCEARAVHRRALLVFLAGENWHAPRRRGANEAAERCGAAASDVVLTDMFS